ncbi:NAD(P)-dependent alcohol dehydrogenase [bacterium]|nr:NAD(P)-dependent alcohol dehydrogenase [bacterium]
MKTVGYGVHDAESVLEPLHFERRALRPGDVAIEILYCGICHSDLHQVRNDWGMSQYPMVPGHEIVGRVLEVGGEVERFQPGDTVAVGCLVDSCQECDQCHRGEEQFCREGSTKTYNSRDRVSEEPTFGGYSKHIVVRQEFVLSVPESLDISRAAPILCAGITTFSPLRAAAVGSGSRVGVIGVGGLGHMAMKLAKAMGATVTAITRTSEKGEAARRIGADAVLVSNDQASMEAAANAFDLLIDTVPVKHNLDRYLPLLDIDGKLVLVGQLGQMEEVSTLPLVLGNRSVSGSLIGGIPETQEVLNFCAEHEIHPECEMIRMEEVNTAFDRLERGDISHRFVIDMSSLELS